MKCLVTGATGFIGDALCLQLEQRRAQVLRLGREQPTDAQLHGVKIIYYCAGIAHQSASAADHERANCDAVLQVAERALTFGVERFVYLSTVKADPSAGPYGYWKWRAEQALQQQFANSTMKPVLVRPALVYGSGARANLRSLIRAVQLGMPTPGASAPRSLIGLPDLCGALAQLLEVEPGPGPWYLTDGESYDLRRLHAAICAALGKVPARPWVPDWCWRLAGVLQDLGRPLGGGAGTYQKLFCGEEFSNAESCAALQWRPRQRFEDLVPAMLGER